MGLFVPGRVGGRRGRLLGDGRGFSPGLQTGDFDFTTPLTQTFPTNQPGFSAVGLPWSPQNLFDFQDAGPTIFDSINGENMSGTRPVFQRDAIGLWNGADYNGHGRMVEEWQGVLSGSQLQTGGGSGRLDFGANSMAGLLVFRQMTTATAFDMILAAGAYQLRNVAGSFRWTVGAATTPAGPVGGSYFDGAWRCVIFFLNKTTDFIGLTYFDPSSPPGTGPVTQSIGAGGASATGQFRTELLGSGDVAWRYMVFWEGANAELLGTAALSQAALQSFWVHGQDPSSPGLTTAAHASSILHRVGVDDAQSVGTPSCGVFGRSQIPQGHDPGLSHSSKIGLRSTSAVTGLVTPSDRLTPTWAFTNASRVDPNSSLRNCMGMLQGDFVQATAANGYTESGTVVTVAATNYYLWFWGNWGFQALGNSISGRLSAEEVGVGEIAGVNFTVTKGLVGGGSTSGIFVGLPFTAASAATRLRIRINVSGDFLGVFRANMVQADDDPGVYPRDLSTIAATNWQIAAAAGTYLDGIDGEMIVDWIASSDEAKARHIAAATGAAGIDRRDLHLLATKIPRGTIYDGAGVLHHNIDNLAAVNQAAEHDSRLQWKRSGPSALITDAAKIAGPGGSWMANNAITTIHLGQDPSAANQLRGLIARIRTYDSRFTEPP